MRRVLMIILIVILTVYGQMSYRYDSHLLMGALYVSSILLINATSIMKWRKEL